MPEGKPQAQETLELVIVAIIKALRVSIPLIAEWWWNSFRRHPFIWLFIITLFLAGTNK